MHLIPLFAEISNAFKVIVGVGAVMFAYFVFAGIWASRYVKVGPNMAMVISGRKRMVVDAEGKPRSVGYRIVRGGGTFVWPVFEKVDLLSLELMVLSKSLSIAAKDGQVLKVNFEAQVKIGSSEAMLAAAVEQFLSKTPEAIGELAGRMIEGEFRTMIAEMPAADASQNRAVVARQVKERATVRLENGGFELVDLNVNEMSIGG